MLLKTQNKKPTRHVAPGSVAARHRETIERITQEIPRLRRYARYLAHDAHYADDLVQDCVVRALEKLHTWQPDTNLRAWLITILRNGFLNDCRKNKRRHEAGNGLQLRQAEVLFLPAQQESAATLCEAGEAFAKLTSAHREILMLVAIEGLSYEQASEVLGISIGTVKSRLSRAREALCRLMFDEETAADALVRQ
jgi:RNA polymerase sigma-70 factor (ECF subfamily)